MSMSKQDYADIADQFRALRSRNQLTHREKTMLSELASRLASCFRRRSQHFDTERFLDAAHAYDEQEV